MLLYKNMCLFEYNVVSKFQSNLLGTFEQMFTFYLYRYELSQAHGQCGNNTIKHGI